MDCKEQEKKWNYFEYTFFVAITIFIENKWTERMPNQQINTQKTIPSDFKILQ